jgi:UDP-N-acetylmuramoylalanine--D-glutamate ligase
LLAPACASFDEFSSYAERGKVFERLVGEIARRGD